MQRCLFRKRATFSSAHAKTAFAFSFILCQVLEKVDEAALQKADKRPAAGGGRGRGGGRDGPYGRGGDGGGRGGGRDGGGGRGGRGDGGRGGRGEGRGGRGEGRGGRGGDGRGRGGGGAGRGAEPVPEWA